MKIFDSSIHLLEQALSASALKHKVISSNIANVDTPNYKSKSVTFQTALEQATKQQSLQSYKTNEKHLSFSNEISSFKTTIQENKNSLRQSNGNNVDMDYEMAELAKNQLMYSALTDRINGKFNSLLSVIKEGR